MFTWKAVVLAMAIMGLPLLVRTARAGFEQVNARYESVAATLGASPVRVFLTISLPLAWLLARRKFPGRVLVETFVSLPLVMPPVATGLILLMLLSRRGSIGRVLERLGIEVVFTWKAVVLAMAIMGLPLLVRTARAGF